MMTLKLWASSESPGHVLDQHLEFLMFRPTYEFQWVQGSHIQLGNFSNQLMCAMRWKILRMGDLRWCLKALIFNQSLGRCCRWTTLWKSFPLVHRCALCHGLPVNPECCDCDAWNYGCRVSESIHIGVGRLNTVHDKCLIKWWE